MSERRVSDEQARAIATYKSGSENEPGIEARTLARDLLDSRAEVARLRELLRECEAFFDNESLPVQAAGRAIPLRARLAAVVDAATAAGKWGKP